jgi:hypothetical protein
VPLEDRRTSAPQEIAQSKSPIKRPRIFPKLLFQGRNWSAGRELIRLSRYRVLCKGVGKRTSVRYTSEDAFAPEAVIEPSASDRARAQAEARSA